MPFFYIFAVLAVLLLAYMRFEAGFVKTDRVRLGKGGNCLKILHISDIHIRRCKVPAKKVRKVIMQEKPHFVLLTGDYIEKPQHAPAFLEYLKDLLDGTPAYLCLGNHDYTAFSNDPEGLKSFIKDIEAAGVKVLHNRPISREINGKTYNIIGIDDLRMGNPDLKKALEGCHDRAFMNIAFSHNPDIVFTLPRSRFDYLLCGHLHGGQIWMPFGLEFKLLRRDKLCKMGIRSGLHRINGINLYINRGLGNVVFPLRFCSRPEVTVYHLP